MSVREEETKIPVGTVLVGKYRVAHEVGRGGMAAVYEAEQLSLGTKVALKVLAADLTTSNIVIERFFREARAAASVKSPHIVEVYDSGRLDDGRPFIVMELLRGESLYDRMARIRLMDPADTVKIMTHCAKGLMKAHAAGVVHRDLKPENLFITKSDDGEETTKILDFGLAKFYAPVNPEEKSKRLTREGAVFGTPAYMSPEQVKGQDGVDHRSDLWAVGCMAFECLIGRPVWNMDQGVAMIFAAIAAAPIPVPSKIRRDLPPAFDEWFKKALARNPDERFQTAKELADALNQVWGRAPSGDYASQPSIQSEGKLELVFDDPASEGRIQIPHEEPKEEAVRVRSMPVPAKPRITTLPPPRAPHIIRYAGSSIAALIGVGGAVGVWFQFLKPQVFVPTVHSQVAMVQASETPTERPAQLDALPKWAEPIAEGQALFATGDMAGAQAKFKSAIEQGAQYAGRAIAEQTKLGAAGAGPCKMVAFSRPRIGVPGGASRPSIQPTLKGAVVTWTDDHEQPGKDHAYSILIDSSGRPLTPIRDLTPEAGFVAKAMVVGSDDRLALLFWDSKGREAGVRVRWLDAEGRIAGPSNLVAGARPGSFWPSIAKGPQGYFIVWQDDRDKENDDLYIRRLGKELETIGPETRLTDYVPAKGRPVNVRAASAAVAANAVFVTYRLERDKDKPIVRLRIPLQGDLVPGIDDTKDGGKKDREIGDAKIVTEDNASGDAPSVACGAEGCFITWHGEEGGAFAAMLDPTQGKVIWRKKFSEKGKRPSVAANDAGQVAIAFYEAGRIKMVGVSRDGVGVQSVFARALGDHPRPHLAGGMEKGDWFVAWEDSEPASGANFAREVYAARLRCR